MIALKQNLNLHYIVLGTGGTGGYLIENLARLLATTDNNNMLTIIDGDSVETKNLVRQNFFTDDLDKNKAEVLYQRYATFFPELVNKMQVSTDFIESTADVKELLTLLDGYVPVIIGAVDNNSTRHLISEAMKESEIPAIYIDAGNNERTGQVIIGTSHIAEIANDNEFMPEETKVDTPMAVDVFPEEFSKDKLPTELSCAEHAISAPQNIAANILSATTLFMIVNKLQAGEMISNSVYKFDSSTISISKG